MDLRIVGAVDPARLEAVAAQIREQSTLEHVVRWVITSGYPLDAIAMDEFTHDVVVPVAPDLVLVYDTT